MPSHHPNSLQVRYFCVNKQHEEKARQNNFRFIWRKVLEKGAELEGMLSAEAGGLRVIQVTRGVRKSVKLGFERHGSVTA